MAPTALELQNLHCHYQVYARRGDSIAGLISRRFKARENVAVHALQGIDLTVYEGEVMGVIGHNGAGKSTLLRAISGSIAPTQGSVRVLAQPHQIGINWALNRELSGRRNIGLGLLGLGYTPSEVEELQESIIDFADIGEFIELPLKAYSTGMRQRLGFAIATASSPRILLMDEALAVGDKSFRARSIERVAELREGAGTVIMASHSMPAIRKACDRVLWLQDGKVRMVGDPAEVCPAYSAETKAKRDTIKPIKGGKV